MNSFIEHIISPVLPDTIPVEFAMRGHTSHDDPLARMAPGLEGGYLARPVEYGFSVHAIIDRDYEGQWMYIQICAREADAPVAFGDWHYGFYYRGGDSPWDTWTLDIVHGTKHPSYAEFGAYVDLHAALRAETVRRS